VTGLEEATAGVGGNVGEVETALATTAGVTAGKETAGVTVVVDGAVLLTVVTWLGDPLAGVPGTDPELDFFSLVPPPLFVRGLWPI
jgi:hypothetical protein